jgi:outer membrane protein assembly factor BamD
VDAGDRVRRFALILAAALAAGCSSSQVDIATLTSNSDQVIWEAGQKAMAKRDYEPARQHFRRIIDAFPQSQYVAEARLAMGETYVKEGGSASDILAVAAYREFLTLYPSHPKSDFAQFQVAEAYFRMRNGPDRDQTNTEHALEEYQRLVELYPGSKYAEDARKQIAETRHSLARAEFLAGYFYQRSRLACRAAIARYEAVLAEFPDYKNTDELLFRLAECLHLSGRTPEALPRLARLLEDHPQSPYAEEGRRLLAEWSALPAPSPPVPSPAPGASPAPAASTATTPSPSPHP